MITEAQAAGKEAEQIILAAQDIWAGAQVEVESRPQVEVEVAAHRISLPQAEVEAAALIRQPPALHN